MRSEFDDNSTYIYNVIEVLYPIVTSANYRTFYPTSVNYLDMTTKDESSIIPKAKGNGLLAAKEARLKANTEYRDALVYYREGRGNVSSDTLLDMRREMEDKETDYARLLRRTFRYMANLRTLLLYLYNECHAERPHISRIRNVLSAERIIQVAPFLKYWLDFELCGCNIRNILFRIAEEFRYQLHLGDDISDFLFSAVLERCRAEIEDFLKIAQDTEFYNHFRRSKRFSKDRFDKLPEIQNEYRKWIIPYIQRSIDRRDKDLREYVWEVNTFEFVRKQKTG